MASTPFDSLDSAHEYLRLLAIQVNEVSEGIQHDLAASGNADLRHLDALRLVDFKLQKLAAHLTASRVALNDLRRLRRVMLGESAVVPVRRRVKR